MRDLGIFGLAGERGKEAREPHGKHSIHRARLLRAGLGEYVEAVDEALARADAPGAHAELPAVAPRWGRVAQVVGNRGEGRMVRALH